VAIVIVALFFVGCAGIQLDTPEKKYLAARAELNLLLEQYISLQNEVSDDDHAVAVQAFETADMALDAWEALLGTDGYSPANDVRTWLKAKSVILKILREVSDG
jgi:hypothetical protein